MNSDTGLSDIFSVRERANTSRPSSNSDEVSRSADKIQRYSIRAMDRGKSSADPTADHFVYGYNRYWIRRSKPISEYWVTAMLSVSIFSSSSVRFYAAIREPFYTIEMQCDDDFPTANLHQPVLVRETFQSFRVYARANGCSCDFAQWLGLLSHVVPERSSKAAITRAYREWITSNHDIFRWPAYGIRWPPTVYFPRLMKEYNIKLKTDGKSATIFRPGI